MHRYFSNDRPGGEQRRHHPRHGFGPGMHPLYGRGDFGGFGPGRGRGRGRKARRGDIRTAALLLLAEEPRNGYQIMQEVEERSDGVWSPSPGSVYPALQQLEDEGLIASDEVEGRKAYAITDQGRALLKERGEDRRAPWEEMSGDIGEDRIALAHLMRDVGFAFAQVMRTGSDAQAERAKDVLSTARRGLYGILADGDGEAGASDATVEPQG